MTRKAAWACQSPRAVLVASRRRDWDRRRSVGIARFDAAEKRLQIAVLALSPFYSVLLDELH